MYTIKRQCGPFCWQSFPLCCQDMVCSISWHNALVSSGDLKDLLCPCHMHFGCVDCVVYLAFAMLLCAGKVAVGLNWGSHGSVVAACVPLCWFDLVFLYG